MTEDVAGRLWTAVRSYERILVPLIIAVDLLCTALVLLVWPSQPQYRATALVTPRFLRLEAEELPQLFEAVFETGAVSQQVVEGLGRLSEEPLGGQAFIEPLDDTVAARVVGIDVRRKQAVQIANAAAHALVAELNDIGRGVGRFAVLNPARALTVTEDHTSPLLVAMLAGPVAGIAVAAGVVGLVLAIRRPVLKSEEAHAVTGAPLLARVAPPVSELDVSPQSVPGLLTLLARLFPDGGGTGLLVSTDNDAQTRSRLCLLVSLALASSGPVRLVTSTEQANIARERPMDDNLTITDNPDSTAGNGVATVIDGRPAWRPHSPWSLPSDTPTTLVVVQGTPQSRVESLTSEFPPDDILGVVFVENRVNALSKERRTRLPGQRGAGPTRRRTKVGTAPGPR